MVVKLPIDGAHPSPKAVHSLQSEASLAGEGAAIRVSIVVPAYNAARYVGAALDSAARQTESRIEILVIDDRSEDETRSVVAAAASRDSRIRLIDMPRNLGPAAARNRGIEAARGEWLALLDADDRFHPERIARLLALGERTAADLVADNILLCPASGSEASEPMISPKQLHAPRLLTAAGFVLGNVGSRARPRVSLGFLQPMIRREFLRTHELRYDERNRFGEDFLFYLQCLLKGALWWLLPETLYFYTLRPGSLTEVQSAADLNRIRFFERNLLGDPLLPPDLRNALRRHLGVIERSYYYRAFTDAVKQSQWPAALSILLETPKGARHIAAESLAQTPTIIMKALRGGYRQEPSGAAGHGASRASAAIHATRSPPVLSSAREPPEGGDRAGAC